MLLETTLPAEASCLPVRCPTAACDWSLCSVPSICVSPCDVTGSAAAARAVVQYYSSSASARS